MYIGGTNVSGALIIPPEEKRPVVSLDLSEMDQILWIDEENLTAHIQAGIIGQDLERKVGVVTKTLSTTVPPLPCLHLKGEKSIIGLNFLIEDI